MKPRIRKFLLLSLRLIAAIVLLQTLRFKFTGAPESVYIFSTLNLEPWGRIGTGIVELIASVLILWPRFSVWGALLASGVMAGAIISHLTTLGIEVQDDGGLLFITAIVLLFICLALVYMQRHKIFSRTLSPT